MNKEIITHILREYGTGKITAEEANRQLAEAGAGISVDPVKAGKGEWTEQEMKEGFFDMERKHPVYPAKLDLSRRKELAGLSVIQRTKGGDYIVHYDDIGYAVEAVKWDK